jgi:hypothetical protein
MGFMRQDSKTMEEGEQDISAGNTSARASQKKRNRNTHTPKPFLTEENEGNKEFPVSEYLSGLRYSRRLRFISSGR